MPPILSSEPEALGPCQAICPRSLPGVRGAAAWSDCSEPASSPAPQESQERDMHISHADRELRARKLTDGESDGSGYGGSLLVSVAE